MWVAGIIALCQITFLPGAVLFRYLRLRGLNPIERITGMFAASLILNCLLVSLFTALHIHKAPVWWVLIAIEAIYLAGTYTSRAEAWTLDLRHIEALRKLSFQAAISGILLFAGILVMGYVLYKDWGTVYTANDDVGSWDRWATEWSSGHFPEYTSIYPQLLPSNSSITYVLLGTADVKMFAKAIAPIYDLLPVLLFLSLALRRRDASYLIGGALCAWLWVHYLGMAFMLYGYADVPLAFFGFLTLYCVYRSTGTPDRYAVIAGLIASCGALLTKQGGIYVVGVMAAYSFYWKLRLARQPEKEPPPSAQKQPLPSKEAAAAKRPKHAKQISHAKQPSLAKQPAAPLATVAPPASVARDLPFFRRDTATVLLLVVAGFCAVWYAVKYYQVSRGTEFLQMALLTQGLHHGRSYGERIVATGRMFLTCRAYTAPVFTSAIAVLSIGSLFLQRTRVIALFCLFPFLLLYSMFFSYEIRNAALAFPFIALVCGETLHKWLGRFLASLPGRAASTVRSLWPWRAPVLQRGSLPASGAGICSRK